MNKTKAKELIAFLRSPVPIMFELWMIPFVLIMVLTYIASALTGQKLYLQVSIGLFFVLGSIWWCLFIHVNIEFKKRLDALTRMMEEK